MKKIYIILLICLYAGINSYAQSSPRNTIDFNSGWKFLLCDDSLARIATYNDATWRSVTLPHDWSIEGSFSETNPATNQGAALPGGIGWYRKTFVLPAVTGGKDVRIEFDGVYRNSEVWINGHYLGKRPYGYSSFSYDLTRYVKKAPRKNVIAVKVDNSRQPNSRWYSGSGIYRNVRLVATNPIAIDEWGVYVNPVVNGNSANVEIYTNAHGTIASSQPVTLINTIYNPAGKKIASQLYFHKKSDSSRYTQEITVDHPEWWSVDHPALYRLHTQLLKGGKLVDEVITNFGIRSFRFDANKGFFLNEKPLKILGVCNHHDLGALGAAVNTRAIERQLEILKGMGCNAIRTAHNPPAPELLDLCDRMGFLVMDEAFDMWAKKKNKFDYYADFPEWHEKDLLSMVLRDRNHPSVFMWSIGNEIREQFDSTGIDITKELVTIIKQADRSRPVTAALSEWNPEKNFMYKAGALDVIGLNYHQEVYADFQKHYPGQCFIGAENMSALATRGHYDLPSDTSYFWPAKSPQKFVEKGNPDFTVSAYDNVSAYWGSTHEKTWGIIKKYDFLSGLFVWAGFDFLGEPFPYPWPARSSYYGIIDLAGFPKDVYYMYQSEWTSKPVLHVFPHWNWQPGQLIDIWAYYNQADEVELFVNGRSLGIKSKATDTFHVMWRVPFEPGTVKAVSRKNGVVVLTKEIHTAGPAAKIELSADRSSLKADGKDLSFITIRIVDKDGNLVPDADNLLHVKVSGTTTLAATDNGYQADHTSFQSPDRTCWKGMALIIVRAGIKQGNSTVTVTAPGLPPAVLTLKTSQ